MQRREFITFLGGAVAWPVATHGQQDDRVRRVGVLMTQDENDTEGQARLDALRQALQKLGWTEGHNLQIELRWTAGSLASARKYAAELIALGPEVILATGGSTVAPLLQLSRVIPVVFVQVVDPVGAGFVGGLTHPGGNATGFIQFEYSLSGKWLELLKEIAPTIKRAAIIRDATQGSGTAQFAVIQAIASSHQMELTPIGVGGSEKIERAVKTFANGRAGGLIVTVGPQQIEQREKIISLAARYQLPAVYPSRYYVTAGGLISYGPNSVNPYRSAANYIDRILKGEKPADLPVQAPTKYEMVINLKTAKALGLTMPPTLLATADDVIE